MTGSLHNKSSVDLESEHSEALNLEYLLVGEILRPHGIHGELRMQIITDFPERLAERETLYFGADYRPHRLLGARRHRSAVLLRMEGVADRDAADAFRKLPVYVHIDDAVPLEEGQFYPFQLLGLKVITDAGRDLGTLDDIIVTGANNVYVVKDGQDEVLLPAIPDVILDINLKERQMLVHILDGLLDE